MKKIIYLAAVFFSIIAISSCTNDENDEKIDLITPNDSTKTSYSDF